MLTLPRLVRVIPVVVAGAVVAACLSASGGAAGRAHEIVLQSGDYFTVYGPNGSAHVVCWVDPSFRVAGSIECYQSTAQGLRPNTYSGAVGTDGASVWFYPPGGQARRVFSRPVGAQPHRSGKARFGHGYELHVGQFASVRGTPVTCDNAADARPFGSIECYLYDSRSRSGVKVNSLSVFVNAGGVEVFRYDASGHSHSVFYRANPRLMSFGPFRWGAHPDYGSCEQAWATDASTTTYVLRASGDAVDADVRSIGTFITRAARSPGACDRKRSTRVQAGIHGTFVETYHFHADGVHLTSSANTCPAPCSFRSFWNSHVSSPYTSSSFVATYTTPRNGVWRQTGRTVAGDAKWSSTGDIVGTRSG